MVAFRKVKCTKIEASALATLTKFDPPYCSVSGSREFLTSQQPTGRCVERQLNVLFGLRKRYRASTSIFTWSLLRHQH